MDQCPQPGQLGAPLAGLGRLRLGRQLRLADNGGHLREGGLGEGGGEKLVIEIPERWSHCQPIEKAAMNKMKLLLVLLKI